MFNSPAPISRDLDEGKVTEVDSIRYVCKVRTIFGKNLSNVKWTIPNGGSSRSGDRDTPLPGDRVVITYGLGYPLIWGYLPETQSIDDVSPTQIGSGTVVDTGNFTSSVANNSGVDLNKPVDMLSGDKIIQSIGGAMLALLRGGSILLRSNHFSEIFLSKYANLVRIVSGNWEHFTDTCSDVVKNWRGRTFRYVGYTNTYKKSKTESYEYNEYYGDTALAEALKTNYNVDVIPPVVGTVIKKEQVSSLPTISVPTPVEYMRRTISLDGTNEVVISDGAATPTFTRIKQQNGVVYISFKDTSFVQINATSITVSKDTNTKAVLDGTGIHITEAGGSSADLTNGVVTLKDKTNGIIKIDGSGNISLTDHSTGSATLTNGDITLTSSGGAKASLIGTMVKLLDAAGDKIQMDAGIILLQSSMGGSVTIAASTAVA